MRYLLFALFLVSLVVLPWWFVVPLGIIVAAHPGGAPVAVLGGVILDAVFGAPIPALYNFAHLYTTVFVLAVIIMYILASRIAD